MFFKNLHKDFEVFLKALTENYVSNREDWHNDTLSSFLEGLYGYNFDSDEKDFMEFVCRNASCIKSVRIK